ncbi:MAG TPA: hypothetical protein VGB07_07755, partial [Blastocatellia bacterium]
MFRPLMHHLERRLHARDMGLRVARPFEWGLEFLGNGDADHDPREFIRQFNAEAIANSERFFTPPPSHASDFEATQEADHLLLRFPSGIVTPYEKNNLVHARYFPAGNNDRAVIVTAQWNAQPDSHLALCHALNRFGISALRLS